jgi:sialate O-acetylesterase
MNCRILFFAVLAIVSVSVKANVTLPGIFGNSMVIQQKQPVNIWGWANPKEKITIEFAGQKKSVITNADGNWKVQLLPVNAGGPYNLIVKGKNEIVFTDVMVGEVWLCSGQSNMEFVLWNSLNASEEINQSGNPMIRQIKVKNAIAAEPAKDIAGGKWEKASPETSGSFTAVGYYFAKKIQKDQNVAVGIINSSWGGTFAEAWISHAAMVKNPDYAHIPELTTDQLGNYYSGFEKKIDITFKKLGLKPENLSENESEWIKPEFDDSDWMDVKVPEPWDVEILPGFDGIAWYRKSFEISEDIAKMGLSLSLGKIEDNDIVYVNGQKVGWNNGNKPESIYSVSPSVLKPGKNVITVRVEDFWEAGGFTGNADNIKVTSTSGYTQSLAGTWKMTLGKLYGIRIRTPNIQPNVLYNGMIAPLIPFSIRGTLWYQGESNDAYAYQYRQILPALINDWRVRWNEDNFPFYIVQLPNYNKFNYNTQNGGSRWAEVRESQFETSKLPNVDLAVITDFGDSTDIHPKNKKDVGERLSLLALKQVYGRDIVYHSPVFKNISFDGNKALIDFDLIGSGLVVKDRYQYLRGFEIAGADKKFYYAQAKLNGNKVTVWSEYVKEPVAVRYSWSDNPDGNLFNADGLPVMPFRTDNWELSTQKNKFNVYLKL